MNREQRTGKWVLAAIVLALCVWGMLLAIGAYLGLWHQGPNRGGLRDARRFWIVLAVVAAFLTFWGAALAMRARRVRTRDRRTVRPPDEG